jgi:phosphoglucosamine mutase
LSFRKIKIEAHGDIWYLWYQSRCGQLANPDSTKGWAGSWTTYGRVVVGCDTRTSSGAIKQSVTAWLLAAGTKSFDAGMLPMPTLAMATKMFDAGVMVTASHNPPEYNGIKLLNPDGSAFNPRQQQQIEEMVLNDTVPTASWDK